MIKTVRPFLSLASTGLGRFTLRTSRATGARFLRSTLLGAIAPPSWPRAGAASAKAIASTSRAQEARQDVVLDCFMIITWPLAAARRRGRLWQGGYHGAVGLGKILLRHSLDIGFGNLLVCGP